MRTVAGRARRRARALRTRLAQRLLGERRTPGAEPKATSAGAERDQHLKGMVERFTRRQLVGWVATTAEAPPVAITLHVAGLEVARTWTADPVARHSHGQARVFRIQLADLWQYCRRRDRVIVRADGHALPIAEHGMFLRPRTDGPRPLAELRTKLAEGQLFSQRGHLQLSRKLDRQWQDDTVGLYERVGHIVKERRGYEPFLIYGSLLGAVREGGFIGHDPDFDSAYLSRHTTGADAARELQQLAFDLIAAGLHVECKRTALHIYAAPDSQIRIDLFHLYFDANDRLCFPFGIAGTSTVTRADWRGTTPADFAGHRVLVPANAEQLVEHIYGASWRVPKTGFSWRRDRTTRAEDGIVVLEWAQEVYWDDFYSHTDFSTGSTFCQALCARDDLPRAVVDLGCGDGRDSFAFAQAGFRVLGLDRSGVGVGHAERKARSLGLHDLWFATCDVGDAAALQTRLRAAREQTGGGPMIFYLRFFLHAVPQDVQESAMGVIASCAVPGDVLAAEFRTDKDAANEKVHTHHYRRFQNGPAFGARLGAEYGFTVREEREGTGLSPYGDEDPELYRVIARRDA